MADAWVGLVGGTVDGQRGQGSSAKLTDLDDAFGSYNARWMDPPPAVASEPGTSTPTVPIRPSRRLPAMLGPVYPQILRPPRICSRCLADTRTRSRAGMRHRGLKTPARFGDVFHGDHLAKSSPPAGSGNACRRSLLTGLWPRSS